jgi:hypothetical protein
MQSRRLISGYQDGAAGSEGDNALTMRVVTEFIADQLKARLLVSQVYRFVLRPESVLIHTSPFQRPTIS